MSPGEYEKYLSFHGLDQFKKEPAHRPTPKKENNFRMQNPMNMKGDHDSGPKRDPYHMYGGGQGSGNNIRVNNKKITKRGNLGKPIKYQGNNGPNGFMKGKKNVSGLKNVGCNFKQQSQKGNYNKKMPDRFN